MKVDIIHPAKSPVDDLKHPMYSRANPCIIGEKDDG